MYRPVRSAPRSMLWTSGLALAFLLLIVWLPSWAADPDEFQELTSAQQAAKQLAAGLDDTPTPVPTKRSTIPPFRLVEPADRHGKQVVLLLYASDHVQLRLVRGQDTLVSPIDDVTSVASDARRPVLEHAHEGIMALELLIE